MSVRLLPHAFLKSIGGVTAASPLCLVGQVPASGECIAKVRVAVVRAHRIVAVDHVVAGLLLGADVPVPIPGSVPDAFDAVLEGFDREIESTAAWERIPCLRDFSLELAEALVDRDARRHGGERKAGRDGFQVRNDGSYAELK